MMLDKLKVLFDGSNIPVEEPFFPIKTSLDGNPLTLHADGRIEGDYEAIKAYFENGTINAFSEDKMIFWLFMQWWKQQRQFEIWKKDFEEQRHDPGQEESFDWVSEQPAVENIHLPIANNTVVEIIPSVTPADPADAHPAFTAARKERKEKIVYTENGPVKVNYDHI
jgi:hypothetical protein